MSTPKFAKKATEKMMRLQIAELRERLATADDRQHDWIVFTNQVATAAGIDYRSNQAGIIAVVKDLRAEVTELTANLAALVAREIHVINEIAVQSTKREHREQLGRWGHQKKITKEQVFQCGITAGLQMALEIVTAMKATP